MTTANVLAETNGSQPIAPRLQITVPKTTKWDASLAERMMSSIYTLDVPTVLSIRGDSEAIRWYIAMHSSYHSELRKQIYAIYPSAQIESSPKTRSDAQYHQFRIETIHPFSLPILFARELREMDPLALLVGAMTDLESDEEIVYELHLGTSPREEYRKWGLHALYKSNLNMAHYVFSNESMERAMQAKASGADMQMMYGDVAEKAVDEKIYSPLAFVNLMIKVKSASFNRSEQLFQSFAAAMQQFTREQVNGFTAISDKSFPLVLSPAEASGLWHLPTEQCHAPEIVWSSSLATPFPRVLRTPEVKEKPGVIIGKNKFQGVEELVKLNYIDRASHVYVLGKSGFGKSTLFHNMIHQDIQNGHGVGLIDPHGDLVEDVLRSSIPRERAQDVVLFDAADREFPVGMNLMSMPSGVPLEEGAGLVMDMLKKMFAGNWSETQMEQAMYAAIATLAPDPNSTIIDVQRLFSDESFRYKMTLKVTDFVVREFWNTFDAMSEGRQAEVARPINNRLPSLYRNPVLRNIICQDRNLPIRQLMDSRKIVLCSLRGLPETELTTLGTLLMSNFEMAAMSRSDTPSTNRPEFYLYIDEVQNFVSTSLPKVFREARKFNLSMTVGNQVLGDLAGASEAIVGNIGATMMFQLQRKDARDMAMSLGEVGPEDLERLDKYNIVAKMQANGQSLEPFSMTTLPPPAPQSYAEELVSYVRDDSRNRYGRPKKDVEAWLWDRIHPSAARKQSGDKISGADDANSFQPSDTKDSGGADSTGDEYDEFAG